MTNKLFILALAALVCSINLGCQSVSDPEVSTEPIAEAEAEIFTIYLVRHSEKDVEANPSDPPLTECGEARSEHLNRFLDQVHLDAVYSTGYTRTLRTAHPTAYAKDLDVREYDAGDLETFARQLTEAGQDALVVGHSNTTGVLAGLLVGEEIGSFDESIYNRIYQVVVHKESSRLHVLHTTFFCDE